MPLSDKEKKELEMLDDPKQQFFASPTGLGGALAAILSNKHGARRRDRVIKLRTKMRMEELNLDQTKDWGKYYEIREKEEERFDERFGL